MNYLPNGDEEISLIKFIAEYQYLNVSDAQYFFKSRSYYRKRIKNLIDKNILWKIKWNLTLGDLGIAYAKLFKFEYNAINRNEKYSERLVRLASIGAFYHDSNTIKFIPSFSVKDKNIFTMTGRRFIGIFNINGIEYMAYQITKKHDDKYISSVIYDMQKEKQYKNFIIFTNKLNRINFQDFTFGYNQVLIIEDSDENKENLKYLNSTNWHRIIEDNFKSNVVLSEYNFCDYTNKKDKFISTFYFIDTEKINRIKYFLRENENRNAIIICSKDLEIELKKELPNVKYVILDLEQYIDKEKRYYD